MDATLSLLRSPLLLVVWGVITLYLMMDGFRRRDYKRMKVALLVSGALLLLLQVQLEGLQARKDLLEDAAADRSEAAAYLQGALAAMDTEGELAVTTSIEFLQLSQATNAVATQASIAEVQTRVATADSLLTTLLVAITLYAAWQTRIAVNRAQPTPQVSMSAPSPVEIVLIVPRRFAGLRRLLHPSDGGTEQIRP